MLSKKCAKTKSAPNVNYTFLKKPYQDEFKYAKIFAKFSKNKFYSRKTENLLIFFKYTCAKSMQNFFAKIVQSASFCSKSNDRSRSKYRFSRVKVK